MKVLVAQLCLTLCNTARLLCPWDSSVKNTGVGCHSLLRKPTHTHTYTHTHKWNHTVLVFVTDLYIIQHIFFIHSSNSHCEWCCCEHVCRALLLGHMVLLCSTFWGTTNLFSTVAAPFYILTSNVQGFQFLLILTNTCYFP